MAWVISSRPAIIRRVVDLPQPEGPTRTMSSQLLHFQIGVVNRLDFVIVNLVNMLQDKVAITSSLAVFSREATSSSGCGF